MPELQRILFVEDQSSIFAIIELALAKVGRFEVYGFASGVEAVAQAGNLKPQLLLLDVMMPDLDGPATLARLRQIEALACVPAVFLTAKLEPQQIDWLRSLGAEAVLFKPFDPMTLASQLRDIWLQSSGNGPAPLPKEQGPG
jgi:CheY-like chemotaxis protein